jgi:hypothetical protein
MMVAARAQSPSVPPRSTENGARNNGAASIEAGPLQGLARATIAQIQLAFRYNEEERAHRREQVAAAVAAWRAAGRSAANDQLLTEWLREAIRKSMPGSREPLPELPKFTRPTAARPATTTATATLGNPAAAKNMLPSSTTRQKLVVQDAGAARRPVQSPRSAAEHSLVGNEPTGKDTATNRSLPSTSNTAHKVAAEQDGESDFWSAHPSNGELPAELSGDPFRDDP